ncbi:MAG: 2Fe-2S iron-sulfur cluster binding domain-containing protein [Myxococcales bacterium]|nr:2Fe-2S iron-sulfur cluster binding domain-containing protein [Myxococcales bacterium]
MAHIVYPDIGLEAEIAIGQSILEASTSCGAPEGSRCGGVRACSTCHVYVHSGAEHLNEVSDDEQELLELSARELRPSSRLGCQARVIADAQIEIEISDESFREYLDLNPEDRERAMTLWRRRKR